MGDTNRYKDYDSDSMEQLREDVLELLEEEDELWNYKIKDKLDPSDYGWVESTMHRALKTLREKVYEESIIKVETEKDGAVEKKKWVRLDD